MQICASRATPIFKSFLRELIRVKPTQYFNKSDTIQSSVGMIFKLYSQQSLSNTNDILKSQYDNIQLLFTQRAGYQRDRNAYNVVFPGGQCDEKQSDLEACKRQLKEQIQLSVDQQCIYLGQLPANFYYLKKRGKKVYISCHVWCMKQSELAWKEQLNPDQLRESKWVDYSELLKNQNYVNEQALRLGLLERMQMNTTLIDNIRKNITGVIMPELNLGMERNLWGLTLWVWSFTLQMAFRNLIDQYPITIVEREELRLLKKWIDHMSMLQVNFKSYYPLKYPILFAVKYWHLMNRVRPFTYERESERKAKFILLTIFIWVILIVSSM